MFCIKSEPKRGDHYYIFSNNGPLYKHTMTIYESVCMCTGMAYMPRCMHSTHMYAYRVSGYTLLPVRTAVLQLCVSGQPLQCSPLVIHYFRLVMDETVCVIGVAW